MDHITTADKQRLEEQEKAYWEKAENSFLHRKFGGASAAATGIVPLADRSPTADQITEQRLVALGKTAPRLSPDDLQANITDTEIVTHVTKGGQILRWAILTTKSGFAVVGRPSASVSAENDVPAIGEETAIANSTQELWPLMGYELKCRLAAAAQPQQVLV